MLLPQPEQRPKAPARRRHCAPPPEEQLAKLKKRVAVLWLAFILSLSSVVVLGFLAMTMHQSQKDQLPLPGQNYSAETTANPESQP